MSVWDDGVTTSELWKIADAISFVSGLLGPFDRVEGDKETVSWDILSTTVFFNLRYQRMTIEYPAHSPPKRSVKQKVEQIELWCLSHHGNFTLNVEETA